MRISINDFLSTLFPAMLQDASAPLSIAISTYNNVKGYKDGTYQTETEDVVAHIQNGYCATNLTAALIGDMALTAGDTATATIMYNEIIQDGNEAQRKVSSNLMNQVQPDTEDNKIFIVYAGVTAFPQALQFTKELRQAYPKSIIFVLTCDCSLHKKEPTLEQFVFDRTIQGFIVSPKCGGESDLKEIFELTMNHFKTDTETQ